jgi:hypothetical protein
MANEPGAGYNTGIFQQPHRCRLRHVLRPIHTRWRTRCRPSTMTR